MEGRELRVLREAAEEIDEAFDWYFERSPTVADRFTDAIEAALGSIAGRPSRWPPVPGYAGTRRCRVQKFPYDIVFREREKLLEVVAVAHQKRKPGYWARSSVPK